MGDLLNSLKNLSMADGSSPNYVWFEITADDGEFCLPPATHFVATVEDPTNRLDPYSEDIDGMDDDEGQGQSLLSARRGATTSWYDVCMVDTPNDDLHDDKEDPVEDKPPGTQSKHRRPRRRSQSRHSRENNTNTGGDNTPDNEDPVETGSEQEDQESGQDSPDEHATYGGSEDSNYLPLSEEEESLGNEEFIMPEEHLEQERFKRRLIATARSLRRKQQQLQVSQDLLNDRWTVVLAAEEYGLSGPDKSHHNYRWFPQYDGKALEPTPPSNKPVGRPQFGLDKTAAQEEHHTNPSGRPSKNKEARGNTRDIQQDLEGRKGHTKSTHRSRRDAPTSNDGYLFGHNRPDHARSENHKRSPPEVLHSVAQHRGAEHPLCFTNEVMEHEFLDGFKSINIESYDGTTNPAVWIEDFLLHIHLARGDDLHAITYLPLNLLAAGMIWKTPFVTTSKEHMSRHQMPMT